MVRPHYDARGKALNARQERFAHEYARGAEGVRGNATEAAKAAGYAATTAPSQGSRLLKNDKVAALVATLTRRTLARIEVTADKVYQEIARIAFSDVGDFVTFGPGGIVLASSDDLPEGATSVLSEVSHTRTREGGTTRIKMNDKLGALRELARLYEGQSDSPEKRAAAIREAMLELEEATTAEAA